MKRISLIILSSLLAGTSLFAQNEIDAIRMSRNDLTGTARSVGMGGAFGALGGDISGVNINPAGIGMYRSSEVVTTMNFRNNKNETSLSDNIEKSKFQFNFDNLAFVGALPIVGSDVVEYVNFGFSYSKLRNFDRKYNMKGRGLSTSMTDYMAERGNYSNKPINGNNWDGDWLGSLALDGGLISLNDNNKLYESLLSNGEKVSNDLYVREKGQISSYDFNMGTTFSNFLSVGLTVSVTDMDYHSYSSYSEDFQNNGGFDLVNNLKTEGTGYQVKAGLILKPIKELRIGVAYHSPTWYGLTDYYLGDLYSSEVDDAVFTPDDAYTDYDFKTPDKWIFSLAGVIGQSAIISVDYELTNYKNNMRFRNADRWDGLDEQNDYINQDFKNASTLRVGAEYRVTPQFSARVGYSWVQSPFNDNLGKNKEAVIMDGTMPHYTVEGDANYFTYGLGYKFTSNFFTDIAFVMKNQKDDLYTFSRFYEPGTGNLLVDTQPGKLKNNMFSGLLTFGYKF